MEQKKTPEGDAIKRLSGHAVRRLLTRFKGKAAPPVATATNHNGADKPIGVRKLIEEHLPDVFTPAAPVAEMRFLQGRSTLVAQIDDALQRRGAHVIIYGERGVGKTSLAQVAASTLSDQAPLYCSASEGDTFENIAGPILAALNIEEVVAKRESTEISQDKLKAGVRIIETEQRERHKTMTTTQPIIKTSLRPHEVARRLADKKALIIIDDFERITDRETKILFSDLIKKLSDNRVRVTLIFVGIGESADDLLVGHESIVRNLVAIHVPRLTDDQIRAIAVTGFNALRLKYEPEVVEQIVRYSANFPYYTHRLCEGVVRAYIRQAREGQRRDWTLRLEDMREAVQAAIRNTHPAIVKAYDDAVNTPQSADRLRHVLYAIAAAPVEPISRAEILQYIAALEGKEDPNIDHNLKRLLEKKLVTKPETGDYCFCDPLQRAYTILRFRADMPEERLKTIDAAMAEVDRQVKQARSGTPGA